METKKVLGVIFSLIFLGAFAFVLSWGIINFNKVQDAMSGTQIYDAEDLDKAYNDGYNTALENKDEYDALINSYRDNITSLNDTISQLNSDKNTMQLTIADYQTQINNLNNVKAQNEDTITTLNNTISNNNSTISGLHTQVSALSSKVANLEEERAIYQTTIESKNSLITNLQSQIDGLQADSVNYNATINSLNTEISSLKAQIALLEKSGQTDSAEIVNLQTRLATAENEKAELQSRINDNEETIDTLNNRISGLNSEINTLNTDINSKTTEITTLNNQINSLQSLVTQLQTTNELNLSTISSLNNQITSLNNQVSELTLQIQNNGTSVSTLNARIKELEDSVAYYQNYIAGLESTETAIATFEFDNSVYNIQVVNKNSLVSVTTPTSTDYVIFNGWTVDGMAVDLSTYTITQNTTFVADVTRKYDVQFKVDNSIVDSQIVTENEIPTLPENPSKEGYEFDGWMLNNSIVDVSSKTITEKIIYVAKFTKIHTVNFVYEDETISTEQVRNGNLISAPSVENTDYKIFNGWKLNNALVDISSYPITADLTFVADVTYRYNVYFSVDGVNENTQIITSGQYATLPANPVKAGYEFDGWMLNGSVVNPLTISIKEDTTFTAKFTELHTATFVYEGEVVETQTIRHNELAKSVNVANTTYKVFNGWTVDNASVNLQTYAITQDTTFVASITYKYDVNFVVDYELYNSQVITKGSVATLPSEPIKEGYEFDAWTLDGQVVEPSTYIVEGNTTFTATFTKLHTVNFVYEDSTISTQTIRNGNISTAPTISNTNYKVFNGWLLNGSLVDVSVLSIYNDTTFVADISYSYDVQFKVQDIVHNSQIVGSGNYATQPSNPELSNYYVFNGWEVNGTIVDVSTYAITENTVFTASLTDRYDVNFMVDGVLFNTQIVTEGSYPTNPGTPTKTNYTFSGWSIDGVNIVSATNYKITGTTTFNAIFGLTQYTLTINNLVDEIYTVSQLPNTTYTLTTPSIEGYTFLGWRLEEGSSGSISGNVFTFGTGDATVYAYFDTCAVSILCYTEGTVVYNGTTYSLYGEGDSAGSMTASLDDENSGIAPAAYIIKPDFLFIEADNNGSLTITITGGTLMVSVESDGIITKTKNSKTSYTITWTDASVVDIVIERSNISFA